MLENVRTHILKTDQPAFSNSWTGFKNYEIRFNDRNFMIGDKLALRETMFTGAEMKLGARLEFTGRFIECIVNQVLHGPIYGLQEGWVILNVVKINQGMALNYV